MKKQKHTIRTGKEAVPIDLLHLLKERSGERLTKIEAYLDLVDKASVQYVPKDLCKQDFSLSQGQFVVTITELSECWHWHRATVRSFIEQLENIGQLQVERLTKSQVITFPSLTAIPEVSPLEQALTDFNHTMDEALSGWASGTMTTVDCATLCEQLYDRAIHDNVTSCPEVQTGKIVGSLPQFEGGYERAFCTAAITSICKATFQRAMSDDSVSDKEDLVNFFEQHLASDWESLIEATKVLADLCIDGDSVALNRDGGTMRVQFQALCKPFLAILTDSTASSVVSPAND